MSGGKRWTADEERLIETMRRAGVAYGDMLPRFAGRTAHALRIKAQAMRRAEARRGRPNYVREVAGPDPRRANLLHLIDLKRAGHSPTRTELSIGAEGGLPLRCSAASAPGYGSSAASCVEDGA